MPDGRITSLSATRDFHHGLLAQNNLGLLSENGRGVPQDFVEAHLWYNLAAAQSSAEDCDLAVKNRDLVAERMTAEQIAEAQRRAREWTPTPEP